MADISGEELMHSFRYCFNLMRRRYHQTVHGKVGTRHGQGKILSILRREDGIPGGCDLRSRSASLSELLDKMQKSGWIQRRVNEKDRRKINIFLTEDGLGISQQMIEARRDMVNTVFGVLNAQEQEQLEILLSKLISELEKPSEEELSGEKPVI